MSLRAIQPSFARGEVSPLLHARVDLASYTTGLARLENFIVLPQGGVARRPGLTRLGSAAVGSGEGCPVKLIPFVYNSEDAMVLEVSSAEIRAWRPSTGSVAASVPSPYAAGDIAEIKYVQSGNMLFLTHRKYPIQQLTRLAIDRWRIEAFEFRGGPWIAPTGEGADARVRVGGKVDGLYAIGSTEAIFSSNDIGKLFRVTATVPSKTVTGTSAAGGWQVSEPVEAGGEWRLHTYGGYSGEELYQSWLGTVVLQKSLDKGDSWIDVRTFTRTDPRAQGNLDISGSEAEEGVLYRVRAKHEEGASYPFQYDFEVSPFEKTSIFRIFSVSPGGTIAYGEWIKGANEVAEEPVGGWTSDFGFGAWGGENGYPACCCFYQDRLVFAGTIAEPQAVWMSRVADYADFGISDPLRDDDAINVTVNADDMDGIYSLVALSDVLAFTASGEWKIKGAGDNGAISPNAVVAHRQDSIGSAPIQPIVAGGQVVMVQTHRSEAHAMRYVFEMDGYSGSNLSILSEHLFGRGRKIERIAYQQIPDSLIWAVLEDGSAATCTYQAEHEVIAWARQVTDGRFGDVACIPVDGYSEAWFAVRRGGGWGIERLAPRAAEALFRDSAGAYESRLTTLRVNLESQGGSMLAGRKYIPRLAAFVLRSGGEARIAPATDGERVRQRRIEWVYDEEMRESEIMLDAGFEAGAGVQLWTDGAEPLTILALSPTIAPGR